MQGIHSLDLDTKKIPLDLCFHMVLFVNAMMLGMWRHL